MSRSVRRAKNLWESKDTSDDDRAIMLQRMQGPQQAAPVAAPATPHASSTAGVGAGPAAFPVGERSRARSQGRNACPCNLGRQSKGPTRHS